MVDFNRLGADLSNVSGVLSGVSKVTSGAPGGSIATDENGNFSLDRLSDTLAKIGKGLQEFGSEQSSPQTGGTIAVDGPTSPATGAPLKLPEWAPMAAVGVGVLLLLVVLFRS